MRIWAIGALALACAVAIGAPRLGTGNQRVFGVGADIPEQPEPGPGLRTEVVRTAPLRHHADSTEGHHLVAVVPRSAVARMEGRPMVFVADKNLKLLVATPVVLGATEGEEQRVLSGVSAGQLVVTEGIAMLEQQGRGR